MKTQFRVVNKEEAHKLIDAVPGSSVLVLTYNHIIGISDYGRYVKKKKSKKMVDKCSALILTESNPVITLNLQDRINDFRNISKSIILPKLE